jgi:cell wall-associated NlpC family hydrolase
MTTGTIRRRAHPRVALGLLATLVAVLLAVVGQPTPAGAATVKSSSTVVAAAAADALASYAKWVEVPDATRLMRYERARDLVAGAAAVELGLDPAQLQAAWAAPSQAKQVAVLSALTQLGVPYRRNTSAEGVGFDCSGLTTYAWGRAGIALPRQSRAQINGAPRIDRAIAQAGDLAYYPGHVMLYLGVGDAMVHAPQPGQSVEMTFFAQRRSSRIVFADPTLPA